MQNIRAELSEIDGRMRAVHTAMAERGLAPLPDDLRAIENQLDAIICHAAAMRNFLEGRPTGATGCIVRKVRKVLGYTYP